MGSKATGAPACKICGTSHWQREPHDRAGVKAVTKPPKVAKPDVKPKHSQGRGAR